ncbi:hypothetical protein [Bacillus cereus]|uniref:hypothetical protein n=1 Tax=Bacillus cereus TaxID=1396 RepID=UPI000BEE7D96|nr:hypothetical protein [Bacillus cereus]PED40393.1 hypothetical protein CON26_30460 [Bacillus cereus]
MKTLRLNKFSVPHGLNTGQLEKCLRNPKKCIDMAIKKRNISELTLPDGFKRELMPPGYNLENILPMDYTKLSADSLFVAADTQLQVLAQDEILGKEGTELLKKIEEVKEQLKELRDPKEMMKKWRALVLGKAEEAAMAYIDEETAPYETDFYQIAPLVILEMDNLTVKAWIYIYISDPKKDTKGMSKTKKFEEISYAVLSANFEYNVTKPFDISQVRKDIESARFKILEDSIKEQLTEQLESVLEQIVLNMMEQKFKSAFHIFESFQKNADLFTF